MMYQGNSVISWVLIFLARQFPVFLICTGLLAELVRGTCSKRVVELDRH
jgi:hypothetical protein